VLKTRLAKLESRSQPRGGRRMVVQFINDWRTDVPAPSPEELNDPNVDVLRVVFVKDWRNPSNG